jgi:hypothetical protein
LADARIKARSGKTAEALQEAQATLNSASKFGYRLYEYQARLAIGEIEVEAHVAAAQSHLTMLEKDAREHGALLVASQAQALAASDGRKK